MIDSLETVEPLLDAQEASLFLRISRSTLRRLIKRGELRGHQVGRKWLFSRRDLKNLVDGCQEERQIVLGEAIMPPRFFSGSCLASDRLIATTFRLAVEALGKPRASLMILENGRYLTIKESVGLEPDVVFGTQVPLGSGIAGWVAKSRQPLLVKDIDSSPWAQDRHRNGYQTASFLCVPILVSGRVRGVINATDRLSGQPFTEADLRTMEAVAQNIASCIESEMSLQEMRRLADTDPLTGLFNARHLNERLAEEVLRANRLGLPLSLLLIDIDHFKQFNDRYGHLAGDRALQEFARCLKRAVRRIDLTYRYGGDEFVVLLPQTPRQEAAKVATRIADLCVARLESIPDAPLDPRLDVSIGLSTCPDSARTMRELFEQADRAMYAAKHSASRRGVLVERTEASFNEEALFSPRTGSWPD
jgi:diguanylate cyclase (GGDEF)-like protein/excisionase family DNA binding protein